MYFLSCEEIKTFNSVNQSINLNCLEYEFLRGLCDSSHFENSPSSQISWTYSDVFQINEKFIHNCPPCLLAEMAKVASSVARPRKCY